MSNSTSSISSIFPAGLSILGGIPVKHQDYAASIIFTGLYILLIPILLWRVCAASSRCFTLIRPAIFVIVRCVTFGIRATQAHGNYTKNLFIAEQILLLCGFILICEPLVTLTKYHVTRNDPPSDGTNRTPTQLVMRILQLGLMAALILGGYAGSQFGDLNDQSTLNTVKTCRDVNAAVCIGVTGLCCLVLIGCYIKDSLPFWPSFHLIVISLLLTVVSAYKLVCYEKKSPSNPLSSGTKLAFYTLSSIPELLVVALLLFININQVFDVASGREKEKISKQLQKAAKNGWPVPQQQQQWGQQQGWQYQQEQPAPYYQNQNQYVMNKV